MEQIKEVFEIIQRKRLSMEWYLPMTIIPGVGLIILSTSNIMLSVKNEITTDVELI